MEEKIYEIVRIDENDYGCEERPANYIPMVSVRLRSLLPDSSGAYEECMVEMEDSIMYQRGLDEGCKAVIGVDGMLYAPGQSFEEEDLENGMEARSNKQSAFMDNYMDALEELDEDA